MLSPAIINDFLGRGRVINVGFLLSLKTIFREITGNVHEEWTSKDILVVANLSVKFFILYKIWMDSRSLSFHGSCITHNLILIIVTRASFDFGEYVFVNHVESYDFKLPIRFPSLICCIWSNQNNDILICDYKVGVSSSVFNFSYKLFIGKHVIGIVIPIASIVWVLMKKCFIFLPFHGKWEVIFSRFWFMTQRFYNSLFQGRLCVITLPKCWLLNLLELIYLKLLFMVMKNI